MKSEDEIKEELKRILSLDIQLEIPPDPAMGDFAFPCFPLAKTFRKKPELIAQELKEKFQKIASVEHIEVKGAYLNFFVNKQQVAEGVIHAIRTERESFGHHPKKNSLVLIESPGPNTNKPLHLGHLRNILIGMSMQKLLLAYGKTTHIVNVVNDRGVHICKSMLAYQKFGNDSTPQSEKRKSDHFVGDFYVKFSQAEKEHPEYEQEIQDMLLKWEQGDKKVRALWKKMNTWALKGFQETYKKLGLKIKKEYLESDTYLAGKELILKNLEKGIFQKDDQGSVIINLEDKGLGNKVLIRANGTAVYITQDIYMAQKRYEDFTFDEMIYVVGNEQDYHFKVLFEIFKKLNFPFAEKCYHFSYGMVELPEGKMKSREGTVIDTDDIIEDMVSLAQEEVSSRYSDLSEKEKQDRAEAIAMAALRFFFLKFDPLKNFVFSAKEALSFEGETGPYIQYSHARICSILRNHGKKISPSADLSLLKEQEETVLLTALSQFSQVIEDAAIKRKPHLLCRYTFELAQYFNEFYHKHQVLKADDHLRDARLQLCDAVRQVIANALMILDIEPLERM